MSYHIAIVEDDRDILDNYADVLADKGYRVSPFTNAEDAWNAFNQETPDLAILDIQLKNQPDGGFDLHRKINTLFPEKPTLFISGRDSEMDKITGLKLGAWDFMSKPVGLDYLTERVRSLIQISESRTNNTVEVIPYSQIGLRISEEQMTVHWFGNRVDLTLTEFYILNLLASQRGRVRSYDELKGITRQRYVEANTVTGHVRRIRIKFQKIDPKFKGIKNVHGVGYRWQG